VNPDDRAFLNPDDMASAIQKWCGDYGEPVPQTEGGLIRCALESLAFKYRMVLEWLEELTGTRIEVLHIVGGGCQNEALNQLTADACGRPVVAGPVEATVLGNVLIQARSAGELKSLADLRQVVRESSAVKTYEPRATAAWNDAYPRFVDLVAKSARNAAV
jgi:rhamnulokinase